MSSAGVVTAHLRLDYEAHPLWQYLMQVMPSMLGKKSAENIFRNISSISHLLNLPIEW